MNQRAGSFLTQQEFDERCPALNGSAWKVYTALVTCRNARTMATPPIGVSLLEQKTGLKRRSIFNALNELETLGFIKKLSKGNRAAYKFLGL